MTSGFIAVICLNDYPHSVTAVYPTVDEANAAGEAERARLREANPDPKPGDYSRRIAYFHYHVMPVPRGERRKADRRQNSRMAAMCMLGGPNMRRAQRRKS